jgi:2-oxoglutarate ferredoxin oxidoreductase subunit beta
MTEPAVSYAKKDFMSDQIIRWCPGCGDYSILSQVQTVFAQLGIARENFAVISGIGCSSRFPYYLSTYGFHTIHGRAPAFATGLKATRPELSVWVVTGDGDALSIGGNQLAHTLRRNVDLNILMFNNRIYGLTKGQYSPTSEVGKRTSSSPLGSIDHPFNPISFALGAGATCIMRSVDVFAAHLRDVLIGAEAHRGTTFVEIMQNCNIFNDGAFDAFTEKDVRDDRVLYLTPGQPLVWGKTTRRGLVADGIGLKIVDISDEHPESACLIHDPTNLALAHLLATLDTIEGGPVPIGLFYKHEKSTYNADFSAQIEATKQKLGAGDLNALLHAGDTWQIG